MSDRSPRARARRRAWRRGLLAWSLVLPLLAVNGVVILWPALQSVSYSFTDWDGVSTPHFVGIDNYVRMFGDSDFRNALTHNVFWTVTFLVVPMLMGLFGAFLLSRVRHFQLLFRVAYFIPYTVATVITATIWSSLVGVDTGLGKFVNINFLGDQFWALPTIAFINNWAWWGFLVVIFLAAMQGVSPALYEAAQIDGAGPWRQFWSITIPSIRPTLIFLCLMTVIWSFLAFDYVFILTHGGPAGASDVLGTLLYRTGLQSNKPGYASAIGVVMALISSVVIGAYLILRRRRGWET